MKGYKISPIIFNIINYLTIAVLLIVTNDKEFITAVGILYDLFFAVSLFCAALTTINIALKRRFNESKESNILGKSQAVFYSLPTSILIVGLSYIGVATYSVYFIIGFFASCLILLITANINKISDLVIFYIFTFIVNFLIFWFDLKLLNNIENYYYPFFDDWNGAKRAPFPVLITFYIFSVFTLFRFLYLYVKRKKKIEKEVFGERQVNIPLVGGKLKIISTYFEKDRIWTKLFIKLTDETDEIYLGADSLKIVKAAFNKIINPNCDSKTYPHNGMNYMHLINLAETYTSLYYSIEDNIVYILIVFNSADPTRKKYFEDGFMKIVKIDSIDNLAEKIRLFGKCRC
jgi:hypothetical protein